MKIFTKITFLLALLLSTFFAQAQNKTVTITGKVINGKDSKPVDYASVAVKSLAKDSAIVGGAVTTPTGVFTIKDLAPGNYKLYIAYLGLKTINKNFTITGEKSTLDLGTLVLENTGVDLATVEIKGEIPPVVVKTDTIEFNAKAFKVKENAVVEDVLKKLPGVEVAKDGSITAQGEKINRVKVDGKDFMGTDPLLATKNLPADMIDKIQIIDEQSEQSKFSGIDDGNREKILNITTLKGKKKGYFGNSTAGYGSDDRYDVNVNINRFNNDQQFSLIGQLNNVNKQNFGGGGGGGGGGRPQGAGGQQQGITNTNAIGLNFADVYSNQTTINGSYFFNKTSLLNINNSFTQNLLGNTISTVDNKANNITDRLNHRLNFTLDSKLDSTTSIRIEPRISYNETDGNNVSNYTRKALTTTTVGKQTFLNKSISPNINNTLLIRKKFQRRGRTLSLNVNTSFSDNDADNTNTIIDNATVGALTTLKVINQLNDVNTRGLNNTTRLVYTEPLTKTFSLELNYQNGYSKDNSDRLIYNFNQVTNQYDILDNTFSNRFENTTLTNAVGFSFNKVEKKYNWNIGLAVLNTDRDVLNITNNNLLTQNFINLTPTAQFRYNFSGQKRLNIQYRGNTQQPSISQIQNIPDNSNTQSVVLGNPNLIPAFNNNLSIRYNRFDFAKFRSLFAVLSLTQTFNAFGQSSGLITTPGDVNFGKIATTFVNVKGNYSAQGFVNVGQPILANNKLSFSLGGGGTFSHATAFTNNLENITRDMVLSGTFKLVSNMDKLDLTSGINGTINKSTFTAQPNSNTQYYILTPNIDISYLFPGNIRLQTDLNYNQVTGRGAGFDTNFTLVNAFVSRQFFKNKGTFKLSVNDLFNQNTGVNRTSNANTIQDINFNVLKRYYMLSFTYSLNKVGARTSGGSMMMPGMGGGMRMGGM